MKDLSVDFSKVKKFRVMTVNTKNGWTDFTDTDNPGKRIKILKASVTKYNKTGAMHKRMSGCGNPNDLVFITTEIDQWNQVS